MDTFSDRPNQSRTLCLASSSRMTIKICNLGVGTRLWCSSLLAVSHESQLVRIQVVQWLTCESMYMWMFGALMPFFEEWQL